MRIPVNFPTLVSVETDNIYPDEKNNLYPASKAIKNWVFKSDEMDEALLAEAVARVATKNDMDANDITYVYPYILRMLKSKSGWAK